jgi:hypothetical protein
MIAFSEEWWEGTVRYRRNAAACRQEICVVWGLVDQIIGWNDSVKQARSARVAETERLAKTAE